MSERCPCGSGQTYSACCAPYHLGGEPADAATLMRSRFSAFARSEHAYLHRTLHPDHEDHAAGPAALASKLGKHTKRARYQALEVFEADGPDADGVARVLFRVSMRLDGKDASFVELSSFAHDGDGWRYVGGQTRAPRSGERPTIATFDR